MASRKMMAGDVSDQFGVLITVFANVFANVVALSSSVYIFCFDEDEGQFFLLFHSLAVISSLFLMIQRDAHKHRFSWKIHVVALHMNYGGDKSSDHGGYCLLEIIPDGLYLLDLGFARILTALLWKQPPWKPPWIKWMGGDADALFIRESLPEPSSILILRRRQFMGLYLSVLKQLPILGKVGTLFYPALVFVDDVNHFNGVSAKVCPRSKNTSLRLTIKSVSLKEAFDKRKEVRSQSGINMKSTLLLRIRIRTNWYRVNIPKHVTDAMAFSCTIWKAKEAMPNWHTNRIKGRQKEKKEDNNIQWLLACQTYLERKQRSISFFLLFCLQCMAHISAYVIICISMFCIRLCNTLCPSIF